MPKTRVQLDGAKTNRGAAASILAFAREDQMPTGTAPFFDLGENRFACLVDKDDPSDTLVLTTAYRLARHWVLMDALAADDSELDVRAMHDALDHARTQLQAFSQLKRKVTELETSMADGVGGIRSQVEVIRAGIADALDRLDEALAVADDEVESVRAA